MPDSSKTFVDAVHEFLRDAVLSKVEVDRFLDPKAPVGPL